MATASAELNLKTKVTGASKSKQELTGVSKGLSTLSRSAKIAGVALVALAGVMLVKSVKAAAAFEKQLANISTLMDGDVGPAMERVRKDIIDLAKETGTSLEELADGMFYVVSAQIAVEDQTAFLTATNQLAIAGNTDLSTAIKAVVGTMKAYGDESMTAAEVGDLLFNINKKGFTTFQEIANVMPKVASMANTLGVNQRELAASMATLVGATGDANEVSTQLKAIFKALMNPSEEMSKAFRRMGYETGFAAIEALGLEGVLEGLKTETGDTKEGMAELFNNVRALAGAVPLTGAMFEQLTENFEEMENAQGAVTKAAEKQMKTFDRQYKILKTNLNVALVELGSELLPILIEKFGELNEWLNSTNDAGEKMSTVVLEELIIGLRLLATALYAPIGLLKEMYGVLITTANAAQTLTSSLLGIPQGYGQVISKMEDSTARGKAAFDLFKTGVSTVKSKVIGYMAEMAIKQGESMGMMTTNAEGGSVAINTALDEISGGAGSAGDSIEDMAEKMVSETQKIKDSAIEVRDSIREIGDEISKLVGDYAKDEAEDRANLAKSIVKSEEEIAKLQEERADIISDLAGEITADEKFELNKRLGETQANIDAELAAQIENAALITQLENEVSEVKRVNGLTDLGRAIENFHAERNEANITFQKRMINIAKETEALGLQKGEIIDMVLEREKEIREMIGETSGDYKTALQNEWSETKINISLMIGEYNRLEDARKAAYSGISSAGQGAAGVRLDGTRAGGGSVTGGGSYLVGEQGVEVFTPSINGNITPNNKLGGGINVYFEGVFGQDAAEEIGDMIVDRLAHNIAI